MAEYTKVFENPYPEGWKNSPSHETPITANALQEHTDAIENIEQYLEDNPIGGGSAVVEYGPTEEFEEKKDSYDVGTQFLITDDYDEPTPSPTPGGSNYIFSEEENEIGLFLNHKLYSRMYDLNKTGLTTSSFSVDVGFSDNNMDIIKNALLIRTNGLSQQLPCNCYHLASDGNNVNVSSYSSSTTVSGSKTYLVLEYTKVGE